MEVFQSVIPQRLGNFLSGLFENVSAPLYSLADFVQAKKWMDYFHLDLYRLLIIIISILLIALIFRFLLKKKKPTALSIVSEFGEGEYLKGKTFLVTGGNSGIGLETCKALSYAGARVILCSRSVDAAMRAIAEEIKAPGLGNYTVPNPSIVVKPLDLEDLRSVKALANDLLNGADKIDRVEGLILNAGIMALPTLEHTEAGFEKQIGVNHYGHFYLLQLLEPLILKQQCPCRIVSVSSVAHTMGVIDTNDLHYKKGRVYKKWAAYGQSKLANILFAKSLSERYKEKDIISVSLHPGVINTNLSRSLNTVASFFYNFFVVDKDIPEGAATTLFAALSPSITKANSGIYLDNCAEAVPSKQCQDDAIRRALWEATQQDIDHAIRKLQIK